MKIKEEHDMGSVRMTPDEIVATLRHSNLPTVLVEGKDDFIIYPKLQTQIGQATEIDFFPCGGRNTLLKVFERKAEFPNKKVFFIADKDMWVFDRIPEVYQDEQLIFTSGYSIENDLYADGSYHIDVLLNEKEKAEKEVLLNTVCEWFAFKIVQFKNGESLAFDKISLLNEQVMKEKEPVFQPSFLEEQQFEKAEIEEKELRANYALQLRGKYLFQIYHKIFKKRRGKNAIKYRTEQLLDISLNNILANISNGSSVYLILIINQVKQWLMDIQESQNRPS